MTKLTVFWWCVPDKCWVEAEGSRVDVPHLPGFVFVVHKHTGAWAVTEQTSGCRCGEMASTRKAAIGKATLNLVTETPKSFAKLIKRRLKEFKIPARVA